MVGFGPQRDHRNSVRVPCVFLVMDKVTGHGGPFVILLLSMLFGVSFLTIGVRDVRRTQNLRRTGAKAYGQVVPHNPHNPSQRLRQGIPVVAWQTPDGRRHEYQARMNRGREGRFKVGARVVIYYDPADPDRAMLDGYDGSAAWGFVVLGAAALSFGLFLLATVR